MYLFHGMIATLFLSEMSMRNFLKHAKRIWILQDYFCESSEPIRVIGYSKSRRNDVVFKRDDQGNIKQYNGIFMDSFINENIPKDTIEGYFI